MYTNDKLLINIIEKDSLHSIINLRVSVTKDTYNMGKIIEQYC